MGETNVDIEGLRAFLDRAVDSEVEVQLDELERLLDTDLPAVSRSGYGWWDDPNRRVLWQLLGWDPAPQLAMGTVLFRRVGAYDSAVTSGLRGDFTDYDAWNDAVGQHFFNGTEAGRPVYLDLDDDVLAAIAPPAVAGAAADPVVSLSRVVVATLELDGMRGHTFRRHVGRLRHWEREASSEFPPSLGVLAFLCSIAEQMRASADFGPSNYYGRLCEAVGVPRDSRVGKVLIDDFTHQTHDLWDGLNAWLLAEDGRRGLPTAFAFDHRRHVGLPISQALLRRADHERLEDLFAEYRLRPGQSMALPDMVRLMREWVPGSPLSKTAKRMWKSGTAAQERMATVALIELEAWTGPKAAVPGDVTVEGRIRLSAQLRRLPKPRLNLGLVVRANAQHPFGEYRLADDAGGPAEEALRDTGRLLTLTAGPSEEWNEFEEAADVSVPDLLYGTLRLVSEAGSTLVREPRRLMILRKDQAVRSYIETERAELGNEMLLLSHPSLTAELEAALDACARPGFRRAEAPDLPGLPDGWVLFSDVQLIAPPPYSSTDDLAALVPLSWTSIAFGGGLALPGGHTWHVTRLPEIRVTAVTDDPSICASLHCLQSFVDPSPDELSLGTFEGAAVYLLDGLSLPEGDYEVRLTTTGPSPRFLVRNSFRLRSASTYLPHVSGDRGWIGHSATSEAWASMSAELLDTIPAVFVRGASFQGIGVDGNPPSELPPRSLGAAGVGLEDDEDAPSLLKARSRETPTCLLGGAHHWVIEPQLSSRYQRKRLHSYCKSCGLEKWWPGLPKLKREYRKPQAQPVLVPVKPKGPIGSIASPIRPISKDGGADHDSLLDALCFVRTGPWSTFEKLALQVDDSPWFPLETARLYSALGHIDLVLDPKKVRVAMWAIAPPVLVLSSDGSAVLSGFRSTAFLEAVATATLELGGSVRREPSPDGPSVIRIHGLDEGALASVAEVGSGVTPEPVLISVEPSERVLAMTSLLSDLVPYLPTFSVPGGCRLELFEPSTGAWREVEDPSTTGGYRIHLRPIRYGFMAGYEAQDRRMHLADNRLVKYLAAKEYGQPLVAYDPERRVLRVHLGAQLPGLFERAAVLASGYPPTKLTGGTVEYRNIDDRLARRLWGFLGQT
jgi:hypothetical protein